MSDGDGASQNLPTATRTGQRVWLYPDRRAGKNATVRRRLAMALLVIYLMTPWLVWKGRPVLRLDIDEGVAYAFGLVLRMSDASILAFLLIGMALLLFLATTIRGRIWCGYACPQTVFVEWVIRPIEEWLEGPAHRRRIADRGPRTSSLRSRKAIKHIAFLLVAAVVANSFLAYFISPQKIGQWMVRPPSEHPSAFVAMSFVMLAFYAELAWFREQFCAFLCPYARFQSVLFDRDTPAIAYDSARGDPRGKGTSKGDCIDCGLCVRVCPTGIDIRNGAQLECIMCARCADACDSIMGNLGRPKGLIRLASEREQSIDGGGKKTRVRPGAVVRPRVVVYAAAMVILAASAIWRVASRPLLAMTVTRVQGVAYSRLPDGGMANLFNVRMVNNTEDPLPMKIEIKRPLRAAVLCGACDVGTLAPFQEQVVSLMVRIPDGFTGPGEVVFRSVSTGDEGRSTLLYP
jgi:cytochrome c oxidase accessory protein FixG